MSISQNYLRGCQDALAVVEKVAGKNVAKGVGKMLGMGGAGAAAGGAAGLGFGHAQRAAAGMSPDTLLAAMGSKGERQMKFLPEGADKYIPGGNMSREGLSGQAEDFLTSLKHKAMLGVGKDAVSGTGEAASHGMGLAGLLHKLHLSGEQGDQLRGLTDKVRNSSHSIPEVPETAGSMYGLRDLLNKGVGKWNDAAHSIDGSAADALESAGTGIGGLGLGAQALQGIGGPDLYHNLVQGGEIGGAAGLGVGAAGLARKAMKGGAKKPASGLDAIKQRLGLG